MIENKITKWALIGAVSFMVGCAAGKTNEGASSFRSAINNTTELKGMFFKGKEANKPIKPGDTVTMKNMAQKQLSLTLCEAIKTEQLAAKNQRYLLTQQIDTILIDLNVVLTGKSNHLKRDNIKAKCATGPDNLAKDLGWN